MAENFDLIFGQNASQQYAWNDADYQNGWETIGNIPPTAAQFDALQRRSDTKLKELNDELTPLVNADTADSRQPSTTYSEGDIKYSSLLPTGWFLTCTTAGTTSASELVLPTPIAEGGTVTDGTVVWTIRKPTTVEIPNASSTAAGIMKLYTGVGDNTDGTMTQKAIKALVGNKTPVFTQIMNTNSGSLSDRANNTSTGISGWSAGTSIDLTQSYKNFDKILVVGANDYTDTNAYNLWDVWELQYMFKTSFRFSLFYTRGNEWWVYGNTYHGTQHNYTRSTDTKWVTADQTAVICAVYGIKF